MFYDHFYDSNFPKRADSDNPLNPIEIQHFVGQYSNADLIFLLNEHDFINIGNLLNLDTICDLYSTTQSNILCVRKKDFKEKFAKKIPKIFIQNNWYNCGPEWSNPIIFRPTTIFQKVTKNITSILFEQSDYKRYDESDQFSNSASFIPRKYFMTEIPKTFSKHNNLPPELSLMPTGSCQNSALVIIVKSARANLRNRFMIRSIFSIIQSETSDKFSLYFIIGQLDDQSDAVLSEVEKHGDIDESLK